jgi:hypothetical protein
MRVRGVEKGSGGEEGEKETEGVLLFYSLVTFCAHPDI